MYSYQRSCMFAYIKLQQLATCVCHIQGACKFVAALLHYFFLSVFSWMLCEGVMLYLMLVVVFSSLSKKWWFFLLLGWCRLLIVTSYSSGTSDNGLLKNRNNLKDIFTSLKVGLYIHVCFSMQADDIYTTMDTFCMGPMHCLSFFGRLSSLGATYVRRLQGILSLVLRISVIFLSLSMQCFLFHLL